MGEVWKICKNRHDEEEENFCTLKKKFWKDNYIPSESTFSELYKDAKTKALAAVQ